MIKSPIRSPRPSPNANDVDQALIKGVLQGEEKCFEQLLDKHRPSIFLMVYRRVRQREEAEDVVQQVFLKAFQHLEHFRGDSKFSTWLYTIALNQVRNHVRQRKLRRMDSLDGADENEEPRGFQWPETLPTPEKITQDRWDLEQVFAALENLSNLHRTIFTLHYIQHLPLKDVAIQVGRPVGTVKVYLHRARKMILAQLEGQENP